MTTPTVSRPFAEWLRLRLAVRLVLLLLRPGRLP